jgi:acetylornithine/succinyldiaminopimelate/putrescine aminotransferase/predicted amino acid dehydrogenase
MAGTVEGDYAVFCRPGLAKLLDAVGLSLPYHRALGDVMVFRDERGQEVEVLDFLGGYGASIFGHNHPALVRAARECLDGNLPFNAQASCRSRAGRLAAKLSGLLEARTGSRFVATFASTGAECVEAAIKHALLANHDRVTSLRVAIEEQLRRVAEPLAAGHVHLAPDIPAGLAARRPPGGEPAAILAVIREENARTLQPSASFLSLRRAFHGKTLGALQLTDQAQYRAGFEAGFGLRRRVVDPDDPASLVAAVAEATVRYFAPALRGDTLVVEEQHLANVCALVIEPIQGEGGIHVLDRGFAHACRAVASEHGFPLVVDEIQCGMGRTGTFLYSEQLGIAPDYVLLSKGLGGGLAKVSALLVRSDLYREQFGVVHTSTFAEDDHSAVVALAALELLEHDGGLYRAVAARGQQLFDGARALAREYPAVLQAVRGVGLMIGLHLAGQEDARSPLIRMLGEQELLGYVVSGYLLHEHRVRVAPTLSSTATIRLEPSAFVSEAACRAVLAALRRLCEVLDRQDAYALTRFVAGAAQPPAAAPVIDWRGPSKAAPHAEGINRVAFLGHFVHARDMLRWDQSLRPFTEVQLETLLDRVHDVLELGVQERHVVRSVTGSTVQLEFVGWPVDSRLIARRLRDRDLTDLRARIRRSVEEAEERGCSVVGLGGFTSIVTSDGRKLGGSRIGVTTGNSFTVAIGLDALKSELAARDVPTETARAAVVGAAGNIASIYSELLAEMVPRLCLIGRLGREAELRSVAARIYGHAYRAILAAEGPPTDEPPDGPIRPESVAGRIRETRTVSDLRRRGAEVRDPGRFLLDHLSEELRDPPITLATGIASLRRANIIVAASNSPTPIIGPQHLGEGPVVICDIALPQDTHPEVMERRPDVSWIRGGVVTLPRNPDWQIGGMPLAPGECFACMAETILLGLEGLTGNFSYGPITRQQVKQIAAIGRKHGFALGRSRRERSL